MTIIQDKIKELRHELMQDPNFQERKTHHAKRIVNIIFFITTCLAIQMIILKPKRNLTR